MRYSQQILIVALLLQFLVLCWARTRFIAEPLPASSNFWNELKEIDDNSNNDNDLSERASPSVMKEKKAFRSGYHFGNEERRKKFLGEPSSFQGGHSLQGLWAMPGRR